MLIFGRQNEFLDDQGSDDCCYGGGTDNPIKMVLDRCTTSEYAIGVIPHASTLTICAWMQDRISASDAAIAIVNVGGMNDGVQQQAQCIYM